MRRFLGPKLIPSLPATTTITTSAILHCYRRPVPLRAFSTKMADTTTPTSSTEQHKDQRDSQKPALTLPAPGDISSSNTLEVNGQDLKLDLLGPVVVNEDGSMSRIDNWAEMSEIEKANVRRILVKRNNQRLARLRAQQQDENSS
ncbi:hypothetical protein DFQ26_002161 [Actinomortierella ambigua]|nr:hypothetical protein DFQ26_002161 [Actinomortierella ambigua]